MNAFITGSRAYGTPTERSDIDLVVRMSREDAAVIHKLVEQRGDLHDHATAHDYAMMAVGGIPYRFGNLNLLVTTEDDSYQIWAEGTLNLKRESAETGPVTRERAKQVFKSLRDEAQQEREAKIEHSFAPSRV